MSVVIDPNRGGWRGLEGALILEICSINHHRRRHHRQNHHEMEPMSEAKDLISLTPSISEAKSRNRWSFSSFYGRINTVINDNGDRGIIRCNLNILNQDS